MKRPTRNLLYTVLAFVCVALLVEGAGFELPRALRGLTSIAVRTSSPQSAEPSTSAKDHKAPAGAAVSAVDLMRKACTASSSIETSFNSTPIAEGSTIWFNSAIRVDGLGASGGGIFLDDSRISFAANGSKFDLVVPAATISFDPAATAATASYLPVSGRWATMVPAGYSGEVFLSGLAFPVPAGGLPGGISSVTWSAAFSTDTPGLTAQWQWGAAVYSTFATDYNAIGVKAAEDQPKGARMLRAKDETDSVGTPASLEAFVISGAGGEGGFNFTGTFQGSTNVTPCSEGKSSQPRATSHTTIVMAHRGGTGTLDATPVLFVRKTCYSNLSLCLYLVENLDRFNTITDLAVTNEAPFPGGSPVGVPCYSCTDPDFPNGLCLPFGNPVTTLSPFGPSSGCGGYIYETPPPCSPSGNTFFADQITASGIDTNSGGTPFPVSASTTNGIYIPACTPTPTFTPTPGNQGCTAGFWKQPQHSMFWGCNYAPNALVSSTGLLANTCGCDFSSLTMLQALNGSSGDTTCDAQAKLYQMAVAALLNACSTVQYALTAPQILSEVDAALASCNRDAILHEAWRLNGLNNGRGGCPLGGPGPYSTPTDTPTNTPTWTPTPTATRPQV